MFKGLFLLITLLFTCFLLSLLVKLWCLSKRKARLQQRTLFARQRALPPGRRRYRKE